MPSYKQENTVFYERKLQMSWYCSNNNDDNDNFSFCLQICFFWMIINELMVKDEEKIVKEA